MLWCCSFPFLAHILKARGWVVYPFIEDGTGSVIETQTVKWTLIREKTERPFNCVETLLYVIIIALIYRDHRFNPLVQHFNAKWIFWVSFLFFFCDICVDKPLFTVFFFYWHIFIATLSPAKNNKQFEKRFYLPHFEHPISLPENVLYFVKLTEMDLLLVDVYFWINKIRLLKISSLW